MLANDICILSVEIWEIIFIIYIPGRDFPNMALYMYRTKYIMMAKHTRINVRSENQKRCPKSDEIYDGKSRSN